MSCSCQGLSDRQASDVRTCVALLEVGIASHLPLFGLRHRDVIAHPARHGVVRAFAAACMSSGHKA